MSATSDSLLTSVDPQNIPRAPTEATICQVYKAERLRTQLLQQQQNTSSLYRIVVSFAGAIDKLENEPDVFSKKIGITAAALPPAPTAHAVDSATVLMQRIQAAMINSTHPRMRPVSARPARPGGESKALAATVVIAAEQVASQVKPVVEESEKNSSHVVRLQAEVSKQRQKVSELYIALKSKDRVIEKAAAVSARQRPESRQVYMPKSPLQANKKDGRPSRRPYTGGAPSQRAATGRRPQTAR